MEPPRQPRPRCHSADYLPKSERDLVIWLDAFSGKLPGYQAPFGLTAAEIAAVQDDHVWMAWSVLQVEVFKNELSQRVVFKDNIIDGPAGSLAEPVPSVGFQQTPAPRVVPPGIVPRLRALLQRLKQHPAYTESIGEDLGIIPGPTGARTVLKPMGEALALPHGQVKVNFVKNGFPGVLVECQQAGDTDWTVLGLRVRSGCVVDHPPAEPGQPQRLHFRLRYSDGDTPMGDYSDLFTVTTMP
jgi:hypothetical protein